MLLVDDRQTERFEFDFPLEQRVRSDDELHVAVAKTGVQRPALAGRGRPGSFRQNDRMVK